MELWTHTGSAVTVDTENFSVFSFTLRAAEQEM